MEKYKILDHRADLEIEIIGRNKKEIFQNALLAVRDYLSPIFLKETRKVKRDIKIESIDLPTLLIDFLNEVIYLSEVKKESYTKIEFGELSEKRLKGTLYGEKVGGFSREIKAATYHNLQLKRKKGVFKTKVLFDV